MQIIVFDVPFVLWYKKNFGQTDTKQISTKIITNKVTRKTIETLIDLSYFDSVKKAKKEFINFKEISNIKICDDLNISNQLMKHTGIKYANGYIIKDKHISVGLTGDTSFCEEVKK